MSRNAEPGHCERCNLTTILPTRNQVCRAGPSVFFRAVPAHYLSIPETNDVLVQPGLTRNLTPAGGYGQMLIVVASTW